MAKTFVFDQNGNKLNSLTPKSKNVAQPEEKKRKMLPKIDGLLDVLGIANMYLSKGSAEKVNKKADEVLKQYGIGADKLSNRTVRSIFNDLMIKFIDEKILPFEEGTNVKHFYAFAKKKSQTLNDTKKVADEDDEDSKKKKKKNKDEWDFDPIAHFKQQNREKRLAQERRLAFLDKNFNRVATHYLTSNQRRKLVARWRPDNMSMREAINLIYKEEGIPDDIYNVLASFSYTPLEWQKHVIDIKRRNKERAGDPLHWKFNDSIGEYVPSFYIKDDTPDPDIDSLSISDGDDSIDAEWFEGLGPDYSDIYDDEDVNKMIQDYGTEAKYQHGSTGNWAIMEPNKRKISKLVSEITSKDIKPDYTKPGSSLSKEEKADAKNKRLLKNLGYNIKPKEKEAFVRCPADKPIDKSILKAFDKED